MPHAVASSVGVNSVSFYTYFLRTLLAKAQEFKPSATIEPALTFGGFGQVIEQVINSKFEESQMSRQGQFAAVETAFRNIFNSLLATTSIDEPNFSQIWNLLDILLIFSDKEWCDPALVFWLVEETLESQTIEGCRTVFDYLDSRRERMIAKHWKSKYLIILRACTELLRRLSRAEDTVFCGRVFIYLFQSFPLGDKSAVNLRGEYHVENVTVYDDVPSSSDRASDPMEIDSRNDKNTPSSSERRDDEDSNTPQIAKVEEPPKELDTDALYPIFWALQHYFSRPTVLFEPGNLGTFKNGLEATLAKFKNSHKVLDSRMPSKSGDEHRTGVKRKWSNEDDSGSTFNPKYLTSRDLFELEISDVSFRRHILVQALILTDFLLSQTAKAKVKLQQLKNKSVIYDFTLDEKDAGWATHMKSEIATYLQQGVEGKYYYRMVDTVLSRDKNWVHWKAENCPPFQRTPISRAEHQEAEQGAQKAARNKRLRSVPIGSLDLGFLSDTGGTSGLDELKQSERYSAPSLSSFEGPLADDDFDIERASSEAEKSEALNARASKQWRALRIAVKSKFSLFDKVDDKGNFGVIFSTRNEQLREEPSEPEGPTALESESTDPLAGRHPPAQDDLNSSTAQDAAGTIAMVE